MKEYLDRNTAIKNAKLSEDAQDVHKQYRSFSSFSKKTK